jgi:hypothetical protein
MHRPRYDALPLDQRNLVDQAAAAVAAMNEVGIDIANEPPKPWTDEIVRASDVVVTTSIIGGELVIAPRASPDRNDAMFALWALLKAAVAAHLRVGMGPRLGSPGSG